jgi:tetratricopeptide (TPR) repeat protein
MRKQQAKTPRAKIIPIDLTPSNAERAADLVERAAGCEKSAEARKLAREALKLDPDCIDAMVVLAQVTRLTHEGYIQKIREAVQAGESAMGREYMEKNRGRFWLLTETRPYMRALLELATAQAANGDVLEAIQVLEKILSLNPNDNQGARDHLLALYLAIENLHGAAHLMNTYGNDPGAVFAWGAVFFHMLNGDRARATKALIKALERNPWAVMYFGGRKAELREMYTIGTEEEGEQAGIVLAPAWIAHPDIVVWMAKSIDALVQSPGGLL